MAMAATSILAEQPILPVNELSPYIQKWTIKGRVTNKGQLRKFGRKNGGGEGQLLSFEMLDSEGGQVRATFFNEAVDKYANMVQEGKVYLLSGGQVRIANRQYTTINNRYELNFDRNVIMEEAADDAKIGSVKMNFVDLRTIQAKPLPCIADVCGVVQSAREFASILSKAGKELMKRDIIIADDTGYTMQLTLWGEEAQRKDSDFEGSPIIAATRIRITDFNGRSGSTLGETRVFLNPTDMPEADRLRKWWADGGSKENLIGLSQTQGRGGGGRMDAKQLSLQGVRQASEQLGSAPEFYTAVVRLQAVQLRRQGEKLPLYYLACTEKRDNGLSCNRKVGDSGDCPVCNKQVKAVARLITRTQLQDSSDSLWLSTFDNAAQPLLGYTGEEVREAEEKGDKIEAMMQTRYYAMPFKVSIRMRQETYNGEIRSKVECSDARPVNFGEHGRQLLQEVLEMARGA